MSILRRIQSRLECEAMNSEPQNAGTPNEEPKPPTGVVISSRNVALPHARHVQVRLMPQPIHYETLPVIKPNSSATQVPTKEHASSPQDTTIDSNKPSSMEATNPICSETDLGLAPWEEPTWNLVSEKERAWIECVKNLSEEELVKLVESTDSWLEKVPNDTKYRAGLYDLARLYQLALSSREDEFFDLIFGTVEELENLILDGWIERNPSWMDGQSPSSATPSMPSSNTVGESDASPPSSPGTIAEMVLIDGCKCLFCTYSQATPTTEPENSDREPTGKEPSAMDLTPSAPGQDADMPERHGPDRDEPKLHKEAAEKHGRPPDPRQPEMVHKAQDRPPDPSRVKLAVDAQGRPPDASRSAMARADQNRTPDASGSEMVPDAKDRPPDASGSVMAPDAQDRPPDPVGAEMVPEAQDRPPDVTQVDATFQRVF